MFDETTNAGPDVTGSDAGGRRVWRQDGAHDGAEAALSAHWYVRCKSAAEWVAALGMLVLASPLILLGAALVRLTSAGPAFYSQTRLGRGGRHFRIHKLRTMRHNCEQVGGARWAEENDPRVTPVGRFLRRTHIDELPQLVNVLKGEMSLVGPRPERPEFLDRLVKEVPHYRDRLLVRPGVTGLAQVQLPADTDIASVRRKLAYDLYYIRHLSLWLDVRLIACTAVHLFGVPCHVLARMFGIPPRAKVEHAYKTRRPLCPEAVAELQLT
jgi:lipopolysaccharide/colanic/teichoic acid biosynthesis glycosyltransferase